MLEKERRIRSKVKGQGRVASASNCPLFISEVSRSHPMKTYKEACNVFVYFVNICALGNKRSNCLHQVCPLCLYYYTRRLKMTFRTISYITTTNYFVYNRICKFINT